MSFCLRLQYALKEYVSMSFCLQLKYVLKEYVILSPIAICHWRICLYVILSMWSILILSLHCLLVREGLGDEDVLYRILTNILLIPQFRSIILCDLLLYIDVTFWYLSIDLGLFWGSWFLHRHKIPHPNPMGDMISTKKYCLFKEYFRVVCFICI